MAGVTSHTGRLYALAIALVIFFLTWAGVAARPWASASSDPRLAALAVRQRQLARESLVIRRIVQHRWAVYRVQLRHRHAQIAAAHQAQLAAAPPPRCESSRCLRSRSRGRRDRAPNISRHGHEHRADRGRRPWYSGRARHDRRHAARGRPGVKDPTFWILARATGLTAYVLLTLSLLAGLVVKSRPFGRALKTASVVDTHRFLSLLALGAIGLHGLALTLDQTVRIGLSSLLVPGLSGYRPLATGLGVVAAELAGLVIVSFPLRKRIGPRMWRRLHWATYGVFALATAHGLAAGTDSSQPWAFSLYLSAVFAVATATAWRVLTRPIRPKGANRVQDSDRPLTV